MSPLLLSKYITMIDKIYKKKIHSPAKSKIDISKDQKLEKDTTQQLEWKVGAYWAQGKRRFQAPGNSR